jgi:ABC-type multidrug transport system fused ATPase/permease subunit
MTEGRTTFIIAHRLSTVRSCDLIVMLRDGVCVVEQGGFADMARRSGSVFAEPYNTRFLGKEEKSIGAS